MRMYYIKDRYVKLKKEVKLLYKSRMGICDSTVCYFQYLKQRQYVSADWGEKRYIDYGTDELTQEGTQREKEGCMDRMDG